MTTDNNNECPLCRGDLLQRTATTLTGSPVIIWQCSDCNVGCVYMDWSYGNESGE